MQAFLGAFLSAISYFITAIFLYRILGGRRLIPTLFFIAVLLLGLMGVVAAIELEVGIKGILLVAMTQVAPVLAAWFLYTSVTGAHPLVKIRFRKRQKAIPMDIQTKRTTMFVSLGLMLAAMLLGVVGWFFSEGLGRILFLVIAVLLIALSMILFIQVRHIRKESVILFIGKEKEHVYEYEIKPDKTKVLVTDFYRNPMFIVDKIGEVSLISSDKSIEKHHLYWIATSSKVDMSEEHVKKLSDVPYRDHLDRFEKYHFKRMQFSIGRSGHVTFIKEQTIK